MLTLRSIIGLLNLFLPIEVAGKILLSIWVISFPLSIIYLFRVVHSGYSSLELIGFTLIYNWFFLAGFASFILSLPLVFFTLVPRLELKEYQKLDKADAI